MNFCVKHSPTTLRITFSFFLLIFTGLLLPISAQTIKEKKEEIIHGGASDLDPQSLELLKTINQEIFQKQDELRKLYAEAFAMYQHGAPEAAYQPILHKIQILKKEINNRNEQWRESATRNKHEDQYGLWYQPDTTIEQLIIDYGSQEYVYVMPPEIAALKISVDSNLPIPRSSWSEMLETILTNNGIGFKQLNTYLRQLYPLATNHSGIKLITNRRSELHTLPGDTRISFMLSPEPSDVRRLWAFLDKFVNHASTVLQMVGRDILIIGTVNEIQDLLKLYDFAVLNKGEKEFKLVSLARISAEEMAKILGAVFDQVSEKHGTSLLGEPIEIKEASNGLKVIVLGQNAQGLFLIGTKEEIVKAEQIIKEVDGQLGGLRAKTIYWYTAKNSDAEELAQVLSKIYDLMIAERIGPQGSTMMLPEAGVGAIAPPNPAAEPPPGGAPVGEVIPLKTPERLYQESFYQDGNVAVNPSPVTLIAPPRETNVDESRLNFIVDVKTNSMVMVVEADILPKLKELLRKLDVPKKMVEIEVLLFEKRIIDTTRYGLNLLRVGSAASQTHKTAVTFNDIFPIGGVLNPLNAGITSFILSRPKENGPAFDIVYNFLLSQQDITINANPSVLTMNQTPAILAIVEEQSINTGIFEVETVKGTTLKDAFTRAQYGITLEITPTIHINTMYEEDDCYILDDDEVDYITLQTNVNFDTVQPSPLQPDRPNVTRRNIANEVLIPDGQTVIIGGLRRKNSLDSLDSIPFLGELPGIGKLFSNTSLADDSTEMFIFITPRIVSDPVEDLERIRAEEMCRRPGDIPEFLCNLVEALEWERECLLEGSMKILLGRPPERCYSTEKEYDGCSENY